MSGELNDDDEIILDITHSFRYIPMLTFIVINYARIVKKCRLSAVHYGAFEVLGNYNDVKEIPIEKRNAPIFDLTSFVDLFDWTMGIDRYLATGNASVIEKLTKKETKKINRSIKKRVTKAGKEADPAILFKDPKALNSLAGSMKNFNDVVLTCRGQDITKAVSVLKKDISEVVDGAASDKIKPLSPIIGMLKERFDRFSHDNDKVNIIETAKWCLDNGMYQQGLTILQEGLISYLCNKFDIDVLKEGERNNIITYSYMIFKEYIDADCFKIDMKREKANQLFKLIYSMTEPRNDINHAGWRKGPARPSKFPDALRDNIKIAESLLYHDTFEDKENQERQMLLIFSHELTDRQKQEAKERLGITKFLALEDELLKIWTNIPPELDDLEEYLDGIMEWIDLKGRPGDYALVQGDFGATVSIVSHCKAKGIIPVYATTSRRILEEKIGEEVRISREFSHVKFRKY
ncbi:MAG: CRISPR-associated protein Csx20 [Caldicoprobacterales bacterium]